jgi:CRP-like cAMP-binding protein
VDREQVLFRLFGKYCPEGTTLYTEGSPGEELYVIQSGSVRLARAGHPAEPLGPGDLLGEEAFFGRAQRTAGAEIVADTRLIGVNAGTLDAVVRQDPETARRIAERLLALAQDARSELSSWTIGHILRRIAPHLTAAAPGGIAAADLAERSDLAEPDARLVLEELERRGCLVREGSGYRAPDAALLRRVVDGFADPGGRA